jgi:hypothetical protein
MANRTLNNLSIEKIVNNVGDPIKVTGVSSTGITSNRAVVNVTQTATGLTIGAGKATMEIFNNGDNFIYYGGSGVTAATGRPIFPKSGQVWSQVKTTFSVYLISDTGQTNEVRIIEYT